MTTMADSKLSKNVTKSIGRAKEKILQNLGKVDRTADEIFDDHVANFTKQQFAATRLQKELNNYIRCIRACAAANRSLMEAVGEIYEPEWSGKDQLGINAQSTELIWNDFAHRLAEQVLIPLNTYQGQFPEMRKKIEKRGRKLVDFDGERHSLQALQSNPRRAEAKLTKQRESLEAAKRTYEVLNTELHEELPGLYNSRIVFLVSAMSTLFASENIFHSESHKIYNDMEGIVERLARETAKGTLNFKSSNAILNNTSTSGDSHKDGERSSQPSTPTIPSAIGIKSPADVVAELSNSSIDSSNASSPIKTIGVENGSISEQIEKHSTSTTNTNNSTSTKVMTNGCHDLEEMKLEEPTVHESHPHSPTELNGSSPTGLKSTRIQKNGTHTGSVVEDKGKAGSDDTKHPSPTAPPPEKGESGVLYRVRATYRYQKEDADELSFDAGEIVRVVEYDDPEDQEEGWLMGIKDNGEKGMFPANFTRPI